MFPCTSDDLSLEELTVFLHKHDFFVAWHKVKEQFLLDPKNGPEQDSKELFIHIDVLGFIQQFGFYISH